MGVQYLKLSQLDQAIEALRSAVKLAPEAFSPRLNYGIALLNKKEFSKAEAELRQALKKNDSAPTTHLYLGITLVSLRNLDEAEKELQRAVSLGGKEMSLAHYYLGGVYWGRREYKRAADELETYLQLAPQAPDAERVRKTIQELRSK
jgi:tetratricopeptide (TPR) repeat protein